MNCRSSTLFVVLTLIAHGSTELCLGKLYHLPDNRTKCFWFTATEATAIQGQRNCREDGGNLGTLDNADVSDFVENELIDPVPSDKGIWTGITSRDGSVTWTTWLGDDVPWTNWGVDHPDSNGPCVGLFKSSMLWDNHSCNNIQHIALCEKFVQPTTTKESTTEAQQSTKEDTTSEPLTTATSTAPDTTVTQQIVTTETLTSKLTTVESTKADELTTETQQSTQEETSSETLTIETSTAAGTTSQQQIVTTEKSTSKVTTGMGASVQMNNSTIVHHTFCKCWAKPYSPEHAVTESVRRLRLDKKTLKKYQRKFNTDQDNRVSVIATGMCFLTVLFVCFLIILVSDIRRFRDFYPKKSRRG